MAKTVIGLDFGTSAIRAVEVSDPKKARPTLVRYHEVALPANAAVRGEVIEVDTIASVLKQLWSTGGFKSKDVILGVGSQRVIARDMTVPKMPLQQIRESLPFQVQDMLPVPVGDALLDFYPVSEGMGEGGPVVNGLLVAAVKDAVMANVRAVQAAGLNPIEVDLIPFALARANVPIASSKDTVAMVHVGAVTTSVVVTNRGIPQFVRIIPSGGNDVTSALTSRLDLEPGNAEQVKRAFGLTPRAAAPEWLPAIEIIREVTTDLLGSLRNTINFYVNTRPADPITAVMLSGGGSELIGFAHALEEITRITVVEGNPFERFAFARTVDKDAATLLKSSLAVALGLTLGAKS